MTQAMPKLGIVVSHPIQYYSPLFRFLAKYVDLEVFYCFQPTAEQIGRSGFGAAVDWGIDLLEGYPHRFVENISNNPDTDRFSGIDTPGIGKALKSAGVTHVLIMGWQLKSYWQAYIYCLRHGIPVAARGDSQINPNESWVKSTARRLLYPLFLRRYPKIFFVGQRNKKYLLQNGAKNTQLLFAPHAVDQDFWKPVAHAPKNKNLVRFLWVAKFMPVKRPEDAILSFRKALEKRADMELCMIGVGELLPRCQSLAAGEPRIQFLGFKNQVELRDIYASGDCLLLTSESESWGLVVNEAMSMGLPAIVSDACGCSEDLIDENTGFTYAAGDVGSLTARILEMADLLQRDPMHFRSSLAERNAQYSFTATLSVIKLYLDSPP
jgi:glycosyltransferase involved in cell wall biosynthesis